MLFLLTLGWIAAETGNSDRNKDVHQDIRKLIEEQEDKDGIDLSRLSIGTMLKVQTRNTLYTIEILGNDKFLIEGGRYFPEPYETFINGSTWGGSMLKLNWIGIDMFMELGPNSEKHGFITTSAVKSVKIVAPDKSWEYEIN